MPKEERNERAEPSALAGFGRYAGPATLILASLAGGAKHGYALTKDVESFAGVRLAPGTLYEALARLGPALEGVEVERSAVHGAPAAVLIEASQDAAELVLGTRGHGGFVGLLLGVLSQLANTEINAQASGWCPFLIVVVVLLASPTGLFAAVSSLRRRPLRRAGPVRSA